MTNNMVSMNDLNDDRLSYENSKDYNTVVTEKTVNEKDLLDKNPKALT